MNLFAETYQMSPTMSTDDGTASLATAVLVIVTSLIIIALSYVLSAFLISRLFKKAGVDQWRAWVPVYNSWLVYQLGGQAGWWSILAFVPVVNIVSSIMMYIAMYDIGLKFGKQGVFVLWAILVPIVWWIWLWLDDSKWTGQQLPGQKTSPQAA